MVKYKYNKNWRERDKVYRSCRMQYEDNTGKNRSLSRGKAISYDERIVRLKETKVRVRVKLSAL